MLTSADAAKEAQRRCDTLGPVAQQLLAEAPSDGIRISALLIAKLRFERLLRGSTDANEWFTSDALGFSEAFARYHRDVAPSAFFPPTEAALFSSWLDAQ